MKISKSYLAVIITTIFIATFISASNYLSYDSVLFANISKELLHNSWFNLTFENKDWLDKPHFPFWITALSFKLLNINSFSYNLPGIIFGIIGGAYAFKLTQLLFNRNVAYTTLLLYFCSQQITIAIFNDIRAEAYLLGEILPACYYLLKYHSNNTTRALTLSAFFIALAIMTKGLFVIIPILSGLIIQNIYNKKIKFNIKDLLLLLLIIIFIVPELLSLYLQFDANPHKIIFGQTNVSGIKWFLWESQFGRFFKTGHIIQNNVNHLDFLGILPDMLLPFTLIAIVSNFLVIYKFNHFNQKEKNAIIYLNASYIPMFIVFSLSGFHQLHYIIILLPFILIITAFILTEHINLLAKVTKLQNIINFIIIVIATLGIITYTYLSKNYFILIIPITIIFLIYLFIKKHQGLILITSLTGVLLFTTKSLESYYSYQNYNLKTFFIKYLPKNQEVIIEPKSEEVYLYMRLYNNTTIQNTQEIISACSRKPPFYLIIDNQKWQTIKSYCSNSRIIAKFPYSRNYRTFIEFLKIRNTVPLNENSILLIKIDTLPMPKGQGILASCRNCL